MFRRVEFWNLLRRHFWNWAYNCWWSGNNLHGLDKMRSLWSQICTSMIIYGDTSTYWYLLIAILILLAVFHIYREMWDKISKITVQVLWYCVDSNKRILSCFPYTDKHTKGECSLERPGCAVEVCLNPSQSVSAFLWWYKIM